MYVRKNLGYRHKDLQSLESKLEFTISGMLMHIVLVNWRNNFITIS